MVRVPDAKSDNCRQDKVEVRILDFKTTWSELQMLGQTAAAELHVLNFNKAQDTLETQGAPDTQRTAKVLGRPKDSKGFQKNPKTSK